MKISITETTIDIEVLNMALRRRYVENCLYLIMNSQTENELMLLTSENMTKPPGAYSTYRGYRIATCEALKYGEIEIK